jgi:hypothetical protein
LPVSDADLEAARRLIDEVVDSFEKLEIVLHVVRTGYSVIDPRVIAGATSMSIDEVERCVKKLRADRVLEPAGPWAPAVLALSLVYDEDRLEVLNYMTKTALARVRQDAARAFADAFVLRPKKKGDSDG